MEICEILKKLEGKTIKTADLALIDGVGENLNLTFIDGTSVTIYGEIKNVNEIEIALHGFIA